MVMVILIVVLATTAILEILPLIQSQQQGYSYVNYSNPNAPVRHPAAANHSKKESLLDESGFAFIAAMAIVSVGSIGIYNGVHNSNSWYS